MMSMNDRCLCASSECIFYEKCLRGAKTKRKGIYTVSYLASTCNEESNYKMRILSEDEDD